MENLGHNTDADVDSIGCRFKSRRLFQVIVATMIGLAISGAINLIEGDWTNLDVYVPAQLALLCALWALRKARFELANAVLLVTATLAISVLVWQNSGLRDPAMIAYPAILAFASTMGGRRLFVFLLAMILLVVALVGVANLQGWHVNAVPTHTLGSMINVSIVLSLTAFLIWLMAGDLRTALANVTAENERVRRSQARIEFLATHDSLTGLPNRILARDRFGHAIALARRHQTMAALVFLDLDNFKSINDSLGHPRGDELLRRVGERLTTGLRDSDTVCRQGGDEFLILLGDVRDSGDVAEIGAKLLGQLTAPLLLDGLEVSTSGSMGIAMYPDDGADFDELLKKADIAMYVAKDAGRNALRFFANEMSSSVLEDVHLVSAMRTALARGEFMLHYQPQFDLASGGVVGAEALLRWRHPELGLVPPSRFIPLAEQSGLIVELGAWVLAEACRQMQRWRSMGLADLTISVNVSSIQFQRDVIETDIVNALDVSGLPASALELELTESLLIQDSAMISALLRRLRGRGVSFSIDDFGIGYSNLGYLKRFEVSRLKIDQSFVRRLTDDRHDEAIVGAIIQMSTSLGLVTIAEGVESESTLARLIELGCDQGQGLHWAPAMPSGEFFEFVRDGRSMSWMPSEPERVATGSGAVGH
jgi:diguanylate cyclase (GGDEF)-like protein